MTDNFVTKEELQKELLPINVKLEKHDDDLQEIKREFKEIETNMSSIQGHMSEICEDFKGMHAEMKKFSTLKTWVVGGAATLGAAIGSSWAQPALDVIKTIFHIK